MSTPSGPDTRSGAETGDIQPTEEVPAWRRVVTLLGSLQGYIGLVLVLAIGTITKGELFLNGQNIIDSVGAFAPRGILAVGVTMVILTAGIDLSVGSMLAVATMASALFLTETAVPTILILPLCMLVGLAMGLFNGLAVAWLKIQPFVVTLATLSIFRGVTRVMSDNTAVGTDGGTQRTDSFQLFGTPGRNLFEGMGGFAGIYYPVLALVLAVVVFQLVLSKTTFGRHVYAVGGNEQAARLSGVRVNRVKIAVFALCGLLAGFAGPIGAAYANSADPQYGMAYELDAIAAAVIGGASLAGGRGSIIGTLVGALIFSLLDSVLGLNAVPADLQLVIKGLIVIVAVFLQRPDLFTGLAARFRGRHPSQKGTN